MLKRHDDKLVNHSMGQYSALELQPLRTIDKLLSKMNKILGVAILDKTHKYDANTI